MIGSIVSGKAGKDRRSTAGRLAFSPGLRWLGILVGLVIWPLGVVLWIVLMVKAYKGERYKLPVIGDFVEKQLISK